jgi:hypothetical protein
MVHCGVLVVLTGQFMHFLDYRSDPTKLSLISTLQLDEVYRTTLQPVSTFHIYSIIPWLRASLEFFFYLIRMYPTSRKVRGPRDR